MYQMPACIGLEDAVYSVFKYSSIFLFAQSESFFSSLTYGYISDDPDRVPDSFHTHDRRGQLYGEATAIGSGSYELSCVTVTLFVDASYEGCWSEVAQLELSRRS